VYRIVDSDVKNAQELNMSEEEYKKIINEQGIKHKYVLEPELEKLKTSMADNVSLQEENELLKQKLASIENQGDGAIDRKTVINEANELGIEFAKNIKTESLIEKIEEHKKNN